MLARKELDKPYRQWNKEHGAPYGNLLRKVRFLPGLKGIVNSSLYNRMVGPYALQPNNTIREFEYPWAFYAADLQPGMKVLEIGGGLSGFQFSLDKYGCNVTNVDPGMDAEGVGWVCDNPTIEKLNKMYNTKVELRNSVASKAGLKSNDYNRVFSISVIEHLPDHDIEEVMRIAYDILEPGGYFILTVDLFLDLAPFTDKESNNYGNNVNIKWLCEIAPFELHYGNKSELFGFSEFNAREIQANINKYLLGMGTYVLAQSLVLKKPE